MAKFELQGDDARWFDLGDGGRVKLRTIGAEEFKEIRRKVAKRGRKFILNPATRAMECVTFEEDVDEELQSLLFWDRVICDWEGLFDQDDQPIECTPENKVLLMDRVPVFSKLVAEKLQELAEERAVG